MKPTSTSVLTACRYLIIAGFVFVALTERYLFSEYGSKFSADAPIKLVEKWEHGIKKDPDEQVLFSGSK